MSEEQVVLVKKEVELPKELAEAAQAVGNLFVVMKKQLADGFQAGQDLPVILTEAMKEAMIAVDGAKKVPVEVKAHPAKVGLVAGVLSEQIIDCFVK